MFKIKKQFFLLILIAFFANNLLSSVDLETLTEQNVLDAKLELKNQTKRDRVLKYAVIGAAVCGIGFALFKAMPTISDYLKFKNNRDQVRNDPKLFAQINPEHQSIINQTLKDSLADEIKKNQVANYSWFSSAYWKHKGMGLLDGVPTAAGMVLLPEAMRAVYQKTSYLFEHKNVLSLVKQLSIPAYFVRLEKSLVQLIPNEFVKNPNYKNKPDLLIDAQQLIVSLGDMSSDEKQAHQDAVKSIMLDDCNALIRQMGYVVAYMRYMEEHDANKQILLDNFANQLLQATCEFALQVKASLDAQDEPGLLNAAILFQASYSSAINNFVIFTR